MDDFTEVRGLRPEPDEPGPEVVQQARANLMRAIAEEASGSVVVDLDRRRRRARRAAAGIAAACAVIVGIAVVANPGDGTAPGRAPAIVAGPETILLAAATSVAESTPAGTGSIRHLREADTGAATDPETYDTYVRPDGTAAVGKVGGRLEETSGYLPSKLLTDLPADTDELRARLLRVSKTLGLGYPDERPERALYRLATMMLPDPGVSPEVKAAIYRVLAGLDLTAIKARDLGTAADSRGRQGRVLEFTFEEGYVDRLVIDASTGALLSSVTFDREHKIVGGQVYLSAELVESVPRAAA